MESLDNKEIIPKKEKSDLKVRLITGAVFGVVVLSSIFGGFYSFSGLMILIHLIGLNEYYMMFKSKKGIIVNQHLYMAVGTMGQLLIVFQDFIEIKYFLVFLIIIPMLPFVIALYNDREKNYLELIGTGLSGLIYVSLPVICLQMIASSEYSYEKWVIFGCFIFIWSQDSFAYLFGRKIGKTPLFPSISPKKTWEGTVAGIICSMILGIAFHYILPSQSFLFWIGLAAVQSIFGIFGDLVESKLKRSLGVKDSGKILPGHGGVLDRFDSLLFSAPFTLVYIGFMKGV